MIPSAVAAPALLTLGRRRLTLAAMCIGQGMILLDNTIVNVALPAIQRGLGVSTSNLEWTVNAYVLALASLIVLGGTLGDRYGRKRMFLLGMAVFSLSSLACGLAQRELHLIAARAIQGIGAAFMAPLSLSILVDAYPPDERPTAIGIWASVAGLGFVAGPIVGGALIAVYGWPAIFWVNVPIGAVGIAITRAAVRESRDPDARSLDLPGTALVSVALFLLTFVLVETNEHPWRSAYIIGFGLLAIATLGAFLAWEARAPSPMVPLGLFRNPVWSAANAVYALAYLALAGMFFFVTLYFQNVHGWSAVKTGVSWIPLSVLFLAISPFAGSLAKRFGPAVVSGTGAAIAGLGVLGLAALGPASTYNDAWPPYLLIGLGYGLLTPSVSAAAMAAVGAARAGVGSGILNSARQVGAAVGLAVLGTIGVASVARTWHMQLAGWPEALRERAAALLQQVAGAQVHTVTAALGPDAAVAAVDAFISGYRAALAVAGGALVAAALIAFLGLRARPAPGRAPAQRRRPLAAR